jgi:hypothetical protein
MHNIFVMSLNKYSFLWINVTDNLNFPATSTFITSSIYFRQKYCDVFVFRHVINVGAGSDDWILLAAHNQLHPSLVTVIHS